MEHFSRAKQHRKQKSTCLDAHRPDRARLLDQTRPIAAILAWTSSEAIIWTSRIIRPDSESILGSLDALCPDRAGLLVPRRLAGVRAVEAGLAGVSAVEASLAVPAAVTGGSRAVRRAGTEVLCESTAGAAWCTGVSFGRRFRLSGLFSGRSDGFLGWCGWCVHGPVLRASSTIQRRSRKSTSRKSIWATSSERLGVYKTLLSLPRNVINPSSRRDVCFDTGMG